MPAFNINNLKRFLSVFNIHAKAFVERLSGEVGKSEFDVGSYLSTCTMEVLLGEYLLTLSRY